MPTLTLNVKDNQFKFPLDREFPFVRLKSLRLSDPNFISNLAGDEKIIIHSEIYNEKHTKSINISTQFVGGAPRFREDFKEFGLENIRIELQCDKSSQIELLIEYETENLSVSMTDPLGDFDEHISLAHNCKILFSAPFGQGKSTFINHYFETKQKEFDAYWISTAHYSVGSNEDIIKFIKSDIIYQIIEKGYEFEKTSVSYLTTTTDYCGKNIHRILAPFLLMIPKIGGDMYKMVEKLDMLKSEYLAFHDRKQFNGNEEILDKLHELANVEGGIYEQDFYTDLVRKMVARNGTRNNKKQVLIIDDLDRMDPEHVFRILNVLSIHMDPIKKEIVSNKFGFDKIIVVCDYVNLQRIFEHRYGKGVDFNGYINKYYSVRPFEFDNKKAIRLAIDVPNHTRSNLNTDPRIQIIFELIRGILLDFHELNELKLREIVKMRFDKFDLELWRIVKGKRHNLILKQHLLTAVIEFFLSSGMDYHLLKHRLLLSRQTDLSKCVHIDYRRMVEYGIPYLLDKPKAGSIGDYLLVSEVSKLETHLKYQIKKVQSNHSIIYSSDLLDDCKIERNEFYDICLATLDKYIRYRDSLTISEDY